MPDIGRGNLALILAALAFSLMTVCVKHLDGRLPVAEIVLARSLVSLVITWFMLRRVGISPWGQRKGLLLVRGLLGTAALFCVFHALASLPLAAATILQYTYPTFTTLSAWLLLGEGIRRRIGIAVLLGWLGVSMVMQPEWLGRSIVGLPSLDVSIALAGALFTALAYVCVRELSKREHPLVIVFYFPLISVPITLPFLWNQGVMPMGMEWIWILGVGLFTQLGQIWITEGLTLLPAARASSIGYIQVLFATIWGVLLFAEPVNSRVALGALFVLGATLISLSARQAKTQNQPS
ncbi:MAG: DMT family transporter [Prochlorococcus sp.]